MNNLSNPLKTYCLQERAQNRRPPCRSQAGRLWPLFIFLAASFATAEAAQKNGAEKRVNQLTAGFLFHFTKFLVLDPSRFERKDDPILIGLIGAEDGELAAVLERVAAKGGMVQGRKLEILSIAYVPDLGAPDDQQAKRARLQFERHLRACHFLYTPSSKVDQWRDLFKVIRGAKVFSIGFGQPFLKQGGMVALMPKRRSLIFSVNIDALAVEGLSIKAQLIRHAEIFRSERQ